MTYEPALNKAWEGLSALKPKKTLSVKFLADEYSVDTKERRVLSLACNAPAKDFTSILILHYLIHRLKGKTKLFNEWLSFKELSHIEGYYPAFKQRAIDPIKRKYGSKPEGLLGVLERLPGKKADQGDVSAIINAFEDVPVLVTLWRGDEEFGPEANMLFDKSITEIYSTEDIVVLAGFVAGQL